MKTNIIQNILLILSFMGLVSCSGNSNSNRFGTEKVRLSWDSEYVTMSDDRSLATIDLKDKFDKEDTFDARTLIGRSYIVDTTFTLQIKIKTDAEIVKAEKITHLYPTIWAGMNVEVSQYVYLYNLEYKDILPLNISDGVIEYPADGKGSSSAIKEYFDKITISQIFASIEKVPEEHNKKGDHGYSSECWEKSANIWKRIVQEETQRESTETKQVPFRICPYEIDLVVTFNGKNGEFTKTFHDEAVIGN